MKRLLYPGSRGLYPGAARLRAGEHGPEGDDHLLDLDGESDRVRHPRVPKAVPEHQRGCHPDVAPRHP